MKKFSFIYTLASALMMCDVALSGLTSCSISDDAIDEVKPDVTPEKNVYHVSIPAGFGGSEGTRAVFFDGNTSSAQFVYEEKVYVYKCATGVESGGMIVFTNNVGDDVGYLTPKAGSISADGKTCILEGTISSGTIKTNDVLVLMYNMTNSNEELEECYFNYDNQLYPNATALSAGNAVLDGATARVKVTGISGAEGEKTMTVSTINDSGTVVANGEAKALFTNAQSIFRLNFRFDNNDSKTITLKQLVVASPSIASEYYPLMAPDEDGNFPYHCESCVAIDFSKLSVGYLSCNKETDIFLALCFDVEESAAIAANYKKDSEKYLKEQLVFIAYDGSDYYRGYKPAPADGFLNGRYYRSTSKTPVEMSLFYSTPPFIKYGTSENPTNVYSVDYTPQVVLTDGIIEGLTHSNASHLKIGGASVNYRFSLIDDYGEQVNPVLNTYYIQLDGLLALYNASNSPFIQSNGNIEINLTGDATIYCNAASTVNCINTTGTLKLTGNGDLTLITKSSGAGIVSQDFTSSNTGKGNRIPDLEVSGSGYTVKFKDYKLSDDETLATWTYEVKKTSSPTP